MSSEAAIRVENVHIFPCDASRLRGAYLDLPKAGTERDSFAIDLIGWALGFDSPVTRIECLHAGEIIGGAPLSLDRPDILRAFPDAPGALRSGFRTMLNAVTLPSRADVLIQAVLENDDHVPIAVLSCNRAPLATGYEPRLQPLLVTTLGRTGSLWLVRVLGQHPRIAAYRPFEYEPRMLRYWLALLRAGSEPATYARALSGDLDNDDWWANTSEAFSRGAPPLSDPAIQDWFGRENLLATAAFALSRVDDFYSETARLQGKPNATFFVEKSWPDSFVSQIAGESCPGLKEIVLVRDFRDLVSSVLRLNRKRGYAAFGRQLFPTDREYVRHLRTHTVCLLEYWRSRPAAHLIRYEDLILRPGPTLHAALAALGLENSDEVVQGMLNSAAAISPEVCREHGTSSTPEASIGRWREDLDASLQADCAEAFDDVLEQFGYTP